MREREQTPEISCRDYPSPTQEFKVREGIANRPRARARLQPVFMRFYFVGFGAGGSADRRPPRTVAPRTIAPLINTRFLMMYCPSIVGTNGAQVKTSDGKRI